VEPKWLGAKPLFETPAAVVNSLVRFVAGVLLAVLAASWFRWGPRDAKDSIDPVVPGFGSLFGGEIRMLSTVCFVVGVGLVVSAF
jgi:hypothetical protein